ncbi:MAG: Zn-dependent hydrolase [Rhodospirillaceae bacterium]|nr:Zn-dependent hydrolase [Rhodospirillaceae bacterium]
MAVTAAVDGDRLWRSLMEMSRIGATPGGGVGRLALTDLDKAGRDLFVDWCKEAGLAVRVDRMGNIIGRRAGTDDTAPPVVTGSHLDSQPLGGKFDGAYGVLAGLEVVRALNEAGLTTRAPLEIINWTDEEGVRFTAGVVASGVYAGQFDLDFGRNLPDREGTTTLGRELARIGYDGDAPCGGYPISAFFEAHIEQGPILEREGAVIGAVLGAQGRRCYTVTVTGEEGHAGTLPMPLRRDALVGAARMIDGLNRLAFEFDPLPVITTGYLQVRPNSRNTVPGRVTFSVDIRHPDNALLADICARAEALCRTVAGETGLEVEVAEMFGRDSIRFDPDCVEAVRAAAKRLGLACRDIHSGAGHDACNLAQAAPTGMIFVPCKDGISHNEREYAAPEDLAAGCQVLLEAMVARAGVA